MAELNIYKAGKYWASAVFIEPQKTTTKKQPETEFFY